IKLALADLDRALAEPDCPPRAYFIRSNAYQALGQAEAAARDRAEGLRRRPSDDLGWTARGFARHQEGDPLGALDDFEEALKCNPASLDALRNKAAVLSETLNRVEEAIRVFDRIIAMYPRADLAWNGRGILLARLGRRDEAIRDARKSLELE